MRKNNTVVGLIIKCVLLLFLIIYFMSMLSLLWQSATEDVLWKEDEARKISYCEEYLREKEYGELWEYLELYDLYDSRYDIYWKAVENRLDEIQTIQEGKAGEN